MAVLHDTSGQLVPVAIRMARLHLAGPQPGEILEQLLGTARGTNLYVNVQLSLLLAMASSPQPDALPIVAEVVRSHWLSRIKPFQP